jgi:hypothetical protein
MNTHPSGNSRAPNPQLWSAPAERSGDGAFLNSTVFTTPKRRRTSFAAALHMTTARR